MGARLNADMITTEDANQELAHAPTEQHIQITHPAYEQCDEDCCAPRPGICDMRMRGAVLQ